MLFRVGSNEVFRDGMALDCTSRLPHPPAELDGVHEIRVLPDGTIERYSQSDWAWKPAPELQAYVDGLNQAYDAAYALRLQEASAAAAAAKASMQVGAV